MKNIKINAFKNSYSKSEKMFSIKDNLFDSLSIPIRQIIYLSFGRMRDLSSRFKVTQDFFKLILKINKNHGPDFTIKWLKANFVALQKSLGDDRLGSLRELEPKLPLPRLINGLPAVIQSRDRDLIRKGHKGVILYWSSIFSVYRVLKCSYTLKINTITDPFKGDKVWFDELLSLRKFRIYFDILPKFNNLVKNSNLSNRRISLLRTASPSNVVSWHGIITDAVLTMSDEKQSQIILRYLQAVRNLGWNTKWFESKLMEASELGLRLNKFSGLKTKESMSGEFGQLSVKEEAAGKLRIFALVDSITQNLLSPLHDFMFSVLKTIPNDGTFDQDASVKRSCQKSTSNGMAFSFDLSSATDRLPVDLTVKILSQIFSEEFGSAWKDLMVDRDFYFPSKIRDRYGCPESLRYSVGQPMGALSSWPALALTHHWILQYCSSLLGRTGWEDRYEILGDDLVVFDEPLAHKYLQVASLLGVEINLSKSISSPNKPVFEFAKRTFVGNLDVSPIPFRQLLSNRRLSERVINMISFLKRGLLVSSSFYGTILSKFGSWKILRNENEIKTPLLAILGVLHSLSVIPHRWLVEALVDPDRDFDSLKDFSIPQRGTIKLIKECGMKLRGELEHLDYPFSREEDRHEVYRDYYPEFANVIANTAYTIAKHLEVDLPKLVLSESKNLYLAPSLWVTEEADKTPIPSDETLESAIYGWFDDLLYRDGEFDVGELVDSIEGNRKFYYRQLDIESALEIDNMVSRFSYNYVLTQKEYNTVANESAPIIKILSKIIGGKTSRYLSIERPN